MPSSTAKRVVLHRFGRQPSEAYVTPATCLLPEGIELLTATGALQVASYSEVKALCFGTEAASSDLFRIHTAFERRPKLAGLWTKFVFKDGDQLEGILEHNLLDWPAAGFLITPPRASAARQRVFIPRAALASTELKGVIGAVSTQRTRPKAGKADQDQLKIFD